MPTSLTELLLRNGTLYFAVMSAFALYTIVSSSLPIGAVPTDIQHNVLLTYTIRETHIAERMPVPTTQKALVLPEKHGQWQVVDFPVPAPGPKDVLVKVIATALNPVDWKIQTYGWYATEFPFIAGSDAAGVVEEVGAEVTNVAKGDRIVFQGYLENAKATYQQYTTVPAEITAKIPDNISFEQAASLPLGVATFVTGAYNHHPDWPHTIGIAAPWEEGGLTKHAGKPIFILGGASSVGQYAIQLAKLSNFSPIITTASPHNESLLRSLGATHVLDRSLAPAAILAELPRLTQGKPLEFVFDTISLPETQSLAYGALAPGGSLLLVLPDEIPAEKKKPGENKRVVFVLGNVHLPENREVGVQLYSRLTEWLEKGIIVPNRVEVIPNGLAGIPEGLERLKQNKVSGKKLVVHPQETP
ncbi:GroES-like protein [Trametes elegans]|nr:GroES-like protein [Trametes elegans]